jgi:hypothetical protein
MRFMKRRTDRSIDPGPGTILLIFALLALLALAARVSGQWAPTQTDAPKSVISSLPQDRVQTNQEVAP